MREVEYNNNAKLAVGTRNYLTAAGFIKISWIADDIKLSTYKVN